MSRTPVVRTRTMSVFSLMASVLVGLALLMPNAAHSQPTFFPNGPDSPSVGQPVYFDRIAPDGSLVGRQEIAPDAQSSSSLSALSSIFASPVVVRDAGPSRNRVDIVFMSDGYTEGEFGSYSTSVSQLMSGVFLQAPFYEYANYFNVHRLDIASTDSGVDNDPVVGVTKDSALDGEFWCQGSEENLCANVSKAWQLAAQSRDADQLVVLVNSAKSGGAAYPFSDLAVLSARQPLATESLLHQLGHSLGNLADESDAGPWPTYTGFEPAEPNVSPNNAAAMTLQKIKWYRWLGADLGPQYGGLIGTYEGAMGHVNGIYRPTTTSKMRALNTPFNAPSIEAFLKQIYRLVSPIDDSTPPSPTLTGADTLYVTPIPLVGRSLAVQWFVDGSPVAGATGSTFRPHNFPIANGARTISVTVKDTTTLMRDEAFRAEYMTVSRSWSLPIDEHPPIIVTQPADRTVYPGRFATYSVVATGEALKYQWYRNNVLIAGATAANYNTPVTARSDNGAVFRVVVSNVAGSVTSNNASLTIANRLPVLTTIAAQAMNRSQTKTVPFSVTDADGDFLSVSALIVPIGANPNAQLSVQSSSMQLVTDDTFLGTFNVTVTVSDGIGSVQQTFLVTVANRIPSLVPVQNQLMKWRTDFITVPLTATDLDGDTITYSAALEPVGSAPVVLSLSGNQLKINPDASYLGIFTVKVSASDGRSTVSTNFSVNVYNTAPVIDSIANQSMHWRTDLITVPILATDPDGDPLTLSAGLAPGETASVAVTLSGNTLTINPASTFIGSFNVKVNANDTKTTVSQTFRVDVNDGAPVLQPIPDQSMYWKTDLITLPIVASDPDGDTLTYTAALAAGQNVPVVVSLSGTTLTINPANTYIGIFNVTVSVSDSRKTTSQTFAVNVYNNAPVLAPIADQQMHWKIDKITVPVSATDPDGETITLSASLASGEMAPVLVSMSGNSVEINPSAGYLGSFKVKVRASDATSYTERTFTVTVYNRAPVLAAIPDQRMHWLLDDKKDVAISAVDPDGETVTVTAVVMGIVTPTPTVTSTQTMLTIDPADRFMGSFVIQVTASDGTLSDTRSFRVTVDNAPPDLQPICDRSVAWNQMPTTIPLVANDPDGETLTYSAFVEKSAVAFQLDSVHNFSHTAGSWNYNLTGLQEKYLQGDKGQSGGHYWYMLLPSGDLYEYRGSLSSSVRLATLPTAYYQDPALLIDVANPDTLPAPPVTATLSGSALTLSAPSDYRGTFMVRARANDGQLFDEESFLVTVYDGSLQLEPIAPIRMHWTEGEKTIDLTSRDTDGNSNGLPTTYSAVLADTSLAYSLDQQYHFGELPDRVAYTQNNARGRGEKYILGGTSLNTLFALLPNGELYLCYGARTTANIDSSLFLTRLPSTYYDDLSLLFSVPTLHAAPVSLRVSGNRLTVDPESPFTGKVLLAVTATDGVASDTQFVALEVYNTTPTVQRTTSPGSDLDINWTADSVSVPYTVGDADSQDVPNLAITAKVSQLSWELYDLDQQYHFSLVGQSARDNEYGWREKHLLGTVSGNQVDFVLLPSGRLYRWLNTLSQSTLVATLPVTTFTNPQSFVSVAQPSTSRASGGVQVRVSGKSVVIDPPAQFQGALRVLVEATDGNRSAFSELGVTVTNHPPVIAPLTDLILHWRTDTVTTTVSASDPDGETLRLIPVLYLPGTAMVTVPVTLSTSGNVLTVDPVLGYTGAFTAYVIATTEPAGTPTTFGPLSTSTPVKVSVTNAAPTLGAIGNRAVSHRKTLTIPLTSNDADAADRPYLTYSVSLGTTQHRAYQLSQLYKFTNPVGGLNTNLRGFGEKYLPGTKGSTAATFAILPNGELYEWTGSLPFTNRLSHLPRTYYDNPTQLISTAAPAALPDIGVSLSGANVVVDPKLGTFVGDVPVTVEVTDGNLYASETFVVSETNVAPVISPIAGQSVGYKQTVTATVAVTDADGDAFSIAAAPANASQVNVSVSGNVISVTPKTPYVGTALINVVASDGRLSSQTSFTITYTNRAPTLNAIAAQAMRWSERTRAFTLVGSDPDGDTLTYTGAVTYNPTAAMIVMSGSTMTMTLKNYFSTFYVTAYAFDGVNKVSQTFRVDVSNSAPVITGISDQSVNWLVNKIVLPVSFSDADGDSMTLAAQLSPGTTFAASVSMTSSALTVNLPNRTTGVFTVEVRASDQVTTTLKTFQVSVTNGAPVLETIPDQVIGFGAPSADVTLEAEDPDNDPLIYSAEILNEKQLAYDLDQANNFELRAVDYQYNKLGNNEKYFQGTKNQTGALFTYVVYPSGRLYEWSGQLSTSTYITTLPYPYYVNPALLFNVASSNTSTAPAKIALTGNVIKITPNANYLGAFWIRAKVSDSSLSDKQVFAVSIEDDEGDSGDDDDNAPVEQDCHTKISTRHGDFTCSGSVYVKAEARIGDSASGSKTRTYEMSIGNANGGSLGAGQTGQLVWKSGTAVPFNITYDPAHSVIKLTVNGVTTSYTVNPATLKLSDIILKTTSKYSTDSVTVDHLVFNGASISNTLGASCSHGQTNSLQLSSGGLNQRFTLDGMVTLKFTTSGSKYAKDSDLGLQILFGYIPGHATTCEEVGDRKVTVCHMPSGLANAHTIHIAHSALSAHLAHGDVMGECPGNPADPGDGGGSCQQKKIVTSPNYTLWNSYLGMMDILELTNPGTTDMPVTVSLYSINGALAHRMTITVPAINQFDVIINDLPGFVKDSYGIVKLEFNGPLDGRMMYYRATTAPTGGASTGYDFAFDMPLNDPTYGATAVSFNTNQPSIKPEEQHNIVTNWLSVVNLEGNAQRYSVLTYDSTGYLLLKREIEVPSFGRYDIDGGHELAGPGVVGVHVIVPYDATAEYIAMLTRFGGDAPAGYAPSKYKFAFPLTAKQGQSDPIYAPISNKYDEFNWIEVVNILGESVDVTVNFYARDGEILDSLIARLEPHAQIHFNASAYLGNHETGYTEVVPHIPFSIIAQSMGYLRDTNSNSVTAAYGSQARRALPCTQSGSYNLYLSMQDWLLVANTTNERQTAVIQVTGPNLVSEKSIELAPRSSVYLPIHDVTQFGAKPNTYGLISVHAADFSKRLFAEVMRVRYRSPGSPDFAAPTPVR